MIRALLLALAAWALAGHAPAPVDGLLWALSYLCFFVAFGITAHKLGRKDLL